MSDQKPSVCAWTLSPRDRDVFAGDVCLSGWRPSCWEGQDRSEHARNFRGPDGRERCPYCGKTLVVRQPTDITDTPDSQDSKKEEAESAWTR